MAKKQVSQTSRLSDATIERVRKRQGAGKIVKFNDGKATTIARFSGGRKPTFT
jgi:hypothetical protein